MASENTNLFVINHHNIFHGKTDKTVKQVAGVIEESKEKQQMCKLHGE